MKTIASLFFGSVMLAASLISPLSVAAQPVDQGNKGSADPKSGTFQLVSCTGVVDPRTGKGTVCDYTQLLFTFSRVLRFVFYILSLLVLGMVLYTGFQYLTAGGDAKKLGDAKKMIIPILIGIFFVFAAYLIVYKVILGYLLADKIGDVTKTDIIGTGGGK